MTTKNLAILTAVAAVLGGAAYFTSSSKKMKSPSIVGKQILPAFDASAVARIDIGGAKPLALAATDKGWVVETLHSYPADVTKIRENLLKLQDLKVGQVANGRTIASPAKVALKDASGKELASVDLGDTHTGKPRGQMAQFGGGGYPDGRRRRLSRRTLRPVRRQGRAREGHARRVRRRSEEVDGHAHRLRLRLRRHRRHLRQGQGDRQPHAQGRQVGPRRTRPEGGARHLQDVFARLRPLLPGHGKWDLAGLGPKEELDTSKTYSLDSALSYLDFTGVADPKKTDAELGFATGAVYTVTLKNGQSYTAKVGNATGSDRWVKLSAAFKATGTNATEHATLEKAVKDFNEKTGKWAFSISSYSADNMSKTRKDLVKAKEEPKKDEAKKDDKKPEAPKASPKPEAKKPEAPKKDAPKK